MTLETFFEKFDLFADAPDAVARMRELVLELAVRGKLSERFASDQNHLAWSEFVEEFDQRIYSYDPGVPPPFEIPNEWRWVSLDDLGKTKVRNHVEDEIRVSFVPMALIPVAYGKSATSEERAWGEVKKGFTHFADEDVVMAKITPCFENGKSAVMKDLLNGVGAGTTELHVFRKSSETILTDFVLVYLKSCGFISRGESKMTGSAGQKRVPHDYFASSPFPLPPPSEQKRIVAKVDELMALCDRLEAEQKERKTRHAALARASLARFAAAPTPENLQFLFHPAYAIPPADLRKSILTLAVQGKLVAQDPNDEQDVKTSANNEELRDQLCYELPKTWELVTLSDLAEINGGFAFKSEAYADEGIRVVRISDFDEFGFKDHKIVRHPLTADLQKFTLAEEDILMAMTGGTVGKSYFVRSLPEPMVVNQRVATIKICPHGIPSYIDIVIRSEMTQEVIRKAKNSTNDNISMGDIKGFAIPLPPLAEQRRIVAKVNELMALVDQLETQITIARQTGEKLLEAAVQEILTAPAQPSSIVPLPKSSAAEKKPLNRHFARAVLSGEIVHQLHQEPTFGRIKHQKIFHLCEHLAELAELEGQYHREAAGPLDNRLIYANEKELKRQKWFEETKRDSFGHQYLPLTKAGAHRRYLEEFWPDKLGKIEELINLMRSWDTDTCEMFSTLYAAWNDLILWKQEPTDEAILHEVLEKWHERKQRIPKDRWQKAIAWMRESGYVPKGFGKSTAPAAV